MQINKKVKFHFFAWIIYIVIFLIVDFLFEQKKYNIFKEFFVFGIEIWIFYSFVNSFFFSKRFIKYSVFLPVLFFTISFGISLLLNYFRNQFALYLGGTWKFTTIELITDTFGFYLQFAIYGTGYLFFKLSYVKMEQIKILEAERLVMENLKLELLNKNELLQKNLLQSENDFLRAQINPHFLYNSLNYFYAETFEALPNVGDSIMMLSDIMRYSLTDFKKTGDKAFLVDEIENIENIIKINKLRFGESLHIDFIVEGVAAGKQIVPMMFITLVENMFKHGDLQDASYPATITCKIDATTQKVTFITLNKRSKKVGDTLGGLGTKNIKKRLELLYGNDFTLDFVEEDIALYKATLIIPFTKTAITQSA